MTDRLVKTLGGLRDASRLLSPDLEVFSP